MVPFQEFLGGPGAAVNREHCERTTVKGVVVPAVVEFLADPPADLDAVIERDGEVALVEEIVEIGAKEEAVADLITMVPAARKRA